MLTAMDFFIRILSITLISSNNLWQPIIKSIDISKPKISEQMKLILTKNTFNITNKQSPIQKLEYNPINGDKQVSITLDYIINNGDIGSFNLHLLVALDTLNNDTVINDNAISLSLSIDDNVILSNPDEFPKSLSSDIDKTINCVYHIPQLNHNITELATNKNIRKIIRMNEYTFAMIDSEIDIIEFDGVEISYINIFKDLPEESSSIGEIIDFFIIDQSDLNEKYILLQVNKYLHMYSINKKRKDILNFAYYKKIFYDNNEGFIYKIGLFNKNIILSIANKGLKKIDLDSNLQEIISKTDNEMNMIDFIIDNSYLYAISKGVGLYIYQLNTDYFSNSQVIFHSKMLTIDLYIHPFYGTKFLGISIDQSSPNEEFFLEFIIQNSKLIPNKILTSNQLHHFLPFYSLDKFNSFFYSTINNSLFVIRRGLLAKVNFITYQLPMKKYPKGKLLFSLYNTQEKMHQIALVGSDDDNNKTTIIIVQNMSYANNTLSCSFMSSGIYMLRLIQKIDICMKSISDTAFYNKYCQKIIDIKFNIYMDPESFAIKVIVIAIIVIFSIISIGLFVELFKETNCCRKNAFKIKQPNKIGEYAYMIDDPELNEMNNVPWEERKKNQILFKNPSTSYRSEIVHIRSLRSKNSNAKKNNSKNDKMSSGSLYSKDVINNKVEENELGNLDKKVITVPGIRKIKKK